MDWDFWRRVLLITLIILVIIIGYKRLLQLVGGKERFKNKFAFLGPVERDEKGNLMVNIELPEGSLVSVSVKNETTGLTTFLMEDKALTAGNHQFVFDYSPQAETETVLSLHTHNQKIDRKL